MMTKPKFPRGRLKRAYVEDEAWRRIWDTAFDQLELAEQEFKAWLVDHPTGSWTEFLDQRSLEDSCQE